MKQQLIPNQTIVATIDGPLSPPILGDFEAALARKSPRIGGLGGGSAGCVTSIPGFPITAILTLLTIGILGTPSAQALSTFVPVKPNQPVEQGFEFNVRRSIDKNPQQYRFIVEITAKNAKFWGIPNSSLAIHQTRSGESLNSLRATPCQHKKQRITCNFTVPIKDTRNPELVFLLTLGGGNSNDHPPAFDNFYFPLKTAVKP